MKLQYICILSRSGSQTVRPYIPAPRFFLCFECSTKTSNTNFFSLISFLHLFNKVVSIDTVLLDFYFIHYSWKLFSLIFFSSTKWIKIFLVFLKCTAGKQSLGTTGSVGRSYEYGNNGLFIWRLFSTYMHHSYIIFLCVIIINPEHLFFIGMNCIIIQIAVVSLHVLSCCYYSK